MAITITKYDNFLLGQMSGLANGVVDFDTDDIRVSLHTNTYVPNYATNAFFDTATNEVTGTNYTAGGTSLTGVTLALAGGTVTFDANDVTWATHASGFSTARYAVIRKYNASAAASRLICAVNFGADVGNTIADLVIVWNASGIITWA